jgi:type I restriction enzyme S subunit
VVKTLKDKWPDVSLGDICELKYGKSLPNSQRIGGNIPVFGSNGRVGFHNQAITSGPTIIIGRKGSSGEVNYSSLPCWPIDTTYYIDSTATEQDLRWLTYRLSALGMTRLNRAAAIPGLNRDDAYRLRLLLPPLEDQKHIAAVLDKTDSIHEKQQQSIHLTVEFMRSTFLDMFGEPVTNPKRWGKTKFDAIGSLDRGVSKNRPRNAPELLGGPYPLIQTGDVANSAGYIKDYKSTYSEIGLKQSKMWPAGTLCITIAANIAKTGILTFAACFPDSIVGFIPNKLVTTEYVQSWLGFLQKNLEDNAPESISIF